jgi:hypothetical protein
LINTAFMKSFTPLIIVLLSAVFLTGCATLKPTRTPGDFVRSINFSPLDSFSYDRTVVSGMTYRNVDEAALNTLSKQMLTKELGKRGFKEVESNGDFYVVVKWHKQISSYAGLFDSVDGMTASMHWRHYGNSSTAVRVSLTVEIYDSTTNEIFWRAELPNIFDAIQFSEERVAQSLSRAIQQFPKRIENDPNLPNIE